MRLSGAIALVTGASSGIGAATARALAAHGSRVLVSGRDSARLAAVAADVGGVAVPADLAAGDGPARLADAAVRAARRAGGGIDIVVNNAGVGWSGHISDMPAWKLSELVAVNLTAPMQLTRLLVPTMVGRCRGQVVFVTSIAGVTGVRGEAVYAATKAGLATFAESLAYELADHDVRVSVVVPGVIDTAFFSRRGKPYSRARPAPISAEQVAAAVIASLKRGYGVTYVPRWLRLPARLHGAAPGIFRLLAARYGDPGGKHRTVPLAPGGQGQGLGK